MKNKYDFVIQIIGHPHSGKSTIAHMLEEVFSGNNIQCVNEDIVYNSSDFKEVSGKKVLISLLNVEFDGRITDRRKNDKVRS
jgi:uridine kinase